MGLNNTYLYKKDFEKNRLAHGYKQLYLEPRKYVAPNYAGNKPAGYIITSGSDMARWLKIQIGTFKSSKFDQALINASHTPNRGVEQLEDGSSYAGGWFVYQKKERKFAHGGNNPNYSSFLTFRPEEKLGISVLGNINSPYIENIGEGINKILLKENPTNNVKDLNVIADYIAIVIICLAIMIIAAVLVLSLKTFKDLKAKKEYVAKISRKGFLKITISLIVVSVITYCIYLIPNVFYGGVDWKFLYVWLPQNIKWALYLTYICLWIVYVYYIFINFVKKNNH